MRFAVHKKGRYGDLSPAQYLQYRRTYFRYLSRLRFSDNSHLLRYFGDSFFHDASIRSIELYPQQNIASVTIWRDNDREDLNTFREKNGLKEISSLEYERKPIIYACNFAGIKSVTVKGKLPSVLHVDIMDTEIGWNKRDNIFSLLFSFTETYEILISFSRCTVAIHDKDLISFYTGGLRITLPWCALCRSNLVSKRSFINNSSYGRNRR